MDSTVGVRVGAALEAMLLVPMLRPMFSPDVGIGDYGVELLAREVAERDAHGFAHLVAVRYEGVP